MIKRLIVNADDYGLSEGVCLGILKAHRDGILTSTTCMMNMENIEKYLEMTKDYPNLGLGVHLNITVGKPLTNVSFVDEKGNFKSRDTYTNREAIVSQEELYQEWKAQIEKFIKIMGHKPTHLDSHHHVHLLNSNIDVALKLAHEYDLPIRQETYLQKDFEPVYFEELFYNQDATFEMIDTILHKDVKNYELMCHPAMIDWKLYQISSYNLRRAHELDIICSQKAKEMTKKIELINYQVLKKSSN